jgi:hypothetical protein
MISLGLPVLAVTAYGQDDFPANEVRIESIQHAGSGCRPGSVASNISPDAMAMTVLFSDYIVDTSDRNGRPARKNCDLQIKLKVPAGWAFSILGHHVRGFVSLEEGTIATQGTTVTPLRGAGARHALDDLKIPGAFDGDYENFSEVAITRANWFACSTGVQELSLNTFISVRPRAGFTNNDGDRDNPGLGRNFPVGMITIDSVDNAIGQTYSLSWRKCDGGVMRPIDSYRAVCRIDGPRRQVFSGQAIDANPMKAKLNATEKAVSACKLAMGNRPNQQRLCAPQRAACSFVGGKAGQVRPGGPGGPGHGPGGPGNGPGGPGHGRPPFGPRR